MNGSENKFCEHEKENKFLKANKEHAEISVGNRGTKQKIWREHGNTDPPPLVDCPRRTLPRHTPRESIESRSRAGPWSREGMHLRCWRHELAAAVQPKGNHLVILYAFTASGNISLFRSLKQFYTDCISKYNKFSKLRYSIFKLNFQIFKLNFQLFKLKSQIFKLVQKQYSIFTIPLLPPIGKDQEEKPSHW